MTESQIFHCGVQCLVFRRKKLLLGLRHNTAGAGQWALPGGHVELSETPIETARRELREETGIRGGEVEVGPSFTTYTTELPYVHVPVLFRDSRGTPEIPEGERFSDLGFFATNDLPAPLFAPSSTAIELLRDGASTLAFRRDAGSTFVKVDMVSLDEADNRNRAFSALVISDAKGVSLLVTWGRRDQPRRNARPESFDDLAAGLRRLEDLLARRVRHRYHVTGVVGELALDQVEALLPDRVHLQVVDRELIGRLLEDEEFRRAYARDWYRLNEPLPLDGQLNLLTEI